MKLQNIKKQSSRKWIARQMRDLYVREAQKEGYRSRSAYKLLEIQEKFRVLSKEKTVLDLGCAPGGWSQLVAERAKSVFAIDLNPMEPIDNVQFIQGDFVNDREHIFEQLSDIRFDTILSDASPSSCGNHAIDSIRSATLLMAAVEIAFSRLKPRGCFVGKIIIGGKEKEILRSCSNYFARVGYFKPKSSRQHSSEMYLIAERFDPDKPNRKLNAVRAASDEVSG